jgi:hypothetical protein
MHTLFDFVTQIKAAEYLIAVSAVGVFIVFWEVLKPRPFKSVINAARADIQQIGQGGGYGQVLRTVGHVAAAPFIGLGYIIALPFVFLYAVSSVFVEAIGRVIGAGAAVLGRAVVAGGHALARSLHVSPSFGWHPQEAYFLGRKRRQSNRKEGGSK